LTIGRRSDVSKQALLLQLGSELMRWEMSYIGNTRFVITAIIIILARTCSGSTDSDLRVQRTAFTSRITEHFPEQLTYPQKSDRKCFCQFGYNLFLVNAPLFPITDIVDPGNFGIHSYSKPDAKERNGSMYTCKGGFIDFSHVRTAADWTVYLIFKIIVDEGGLDLPPEAGRLNLRFKNIEQLTLDDVAGMAQKITFERLTWHEVASWYYHRPNYVMSEQQSTFTPEDTYSNLAGTVIGKNIALRILREGDVRAYSEIATDEIQKFMADLAPVAGKKESMEAYDIVDRNKQIKLPVNERNTDVWWDSKVAFRDARYVFKRYVNIGPALSPWLVPEPNAIGCPGNKEKVLPIPQKASTGNSLYDYYEFKITPDSNLFYRKKSKKLLHRPFGAFITKDFGGIITQVKQEMEKRLLSDFDIRNSADPEPHFKRLRKIVFK
jgi:hypothetical protein